MEIYNFRHMDMQVEIRMRRPMYLYSYKENPCVFTEEKVLFLNTKYFRLFLI